MSDQSRSAPDWADTLADQIAHQILHYGMRESTIIIASHLRVVRAEGELRGGERTAAAIEKAMAS